MSKHTEPQVCGLCSTEHADYVKTGMQTMEKLVDERGHVYAAADQILKAGRIAISGIVVSEGGE